LVLYSGKKKRVSLTVHSIMHLKSLTNNHNPR
jgi:hypothetical protein